MNKKILILIAFIVSLSGSLYYAYKRLTFCLPSGESQQIQQEIDQGKRRIILCQGAHFDLSAPVTLKFTGQELTTLGHPTESKKKASLKLINKDLSLAINAYNVENATISNIIVDGNRRTLGQLPSHSLILAGGNVTSQEINSTEIYDSRSWSHLHLNWGDFYRDDKNVLHSKCGGVKVVNNKIGPGGEKTQDKWSDGISVQCENSLVINNQIVDVTDGGIVLFGSANSIIAHNEIIARNQILLVGIALVDYAYEGNYQNTLIYNNRIIAADSFIKTGIAMGPATWNCNNKDKLNYGAIVSHNSLSGDSFGYGYAVNGVQAWTVQNNLADAHFVGAKSTDCDNQPNAPAGAFIYKSAKSQGNFQSEFIDGNLGNIHTVQSLE